jgi:hypothetical protein
MTPVKGALAEPARNFATLKCSSFLDVLAEGSPSGLVNLSHDNVYHARDARSYGAPVPNPS